MSEGRGFFSRLFGGKPKVAATKVAEPAAASVRVSPASAPKVWPSLGVLFDIDNLGATDTERMFYGTQARLIFMKHFDPRAIGRSYLWQGDTQKTLDGNARQFCIAVSVSNPAALNALRDAFASANDKGLAASAVRFSERPVDLDFSSGSPKPVRREPLPVWMWIEDGGRAVVDDPEDLELCKHYGWAYRQK